MEDTLSTNRISIESWRGCSLIFLSIGNTVYGWNIQYLLYSILPHCTYSHAWCTWHLHKNSSSPSPLASPPPLPNLPILLGDKLITSFAHVTFIPLFSSLITCLHSLIYIHLIASVHQRGRLIHVHENIDLISLKIYEEQCQEWMGKVHLIMKFFFCLQAQNEKKGGLNMI